MSELTAPPPSAAPQRGGFLKFWTSLPGVLTGIAALITAVVSLIAILGGPSDDAADSAAPTPSTSSAPATSTSVAAGNPAESTLAPAPPSSSPGGGSDTEATDPGPGQVIEEGRLELRVNDWADLTAGVVSSTRTTGSEFQLAKLGSYALNPAITQTFALPDDGADRAAWVEALERRRDRLLPLEGVREGATICLVTYAERIAALRITALPSVGAPRIAFDYTVWE